MIRSLYGSMLRNLAQVFGARSVSNFAMNSNCAALMRVRSMIGSWKFRSMQIGDDIEQDARRDIGVVGGDGLKRIVTDAAIAAAHEQHADIGDAGELLGVVTGAAGEMKRRDAGAGHGLREGLLHRRRARYRRMARNLGDHGGDATTFGDLFDCRADISDRRVARGVVRRAHVERELTTP